MQVGLREANQQFAKIIDEVLKGKDVVLTKRGKPVARIVPILDGDAADEDDDAFFDRMAAIGLVRRATKRGPLRPFKPVKIRGKSIAETLREMRDEED